MNLSGFLPACITPFVNQRADAAAMHDNIVRWLEIGAHGALVFGSTGEYVYVEDDERRAVLRAARRATPTDRLLLVGCGAESTTTALRYLQEAAEDGADAALVVTPVYYTRGDAAAQRRHYDFLAERSPMPVLLYTVAAYTAYDLPLEAILDLGKHPNIRGIKDSSGDLSRVITMAGAGLPDFAIFTGSPNLAFPALAMGCQGNIAALGNIIPELFVGVYRAVHEGDLSRAAELQAIITQFGAQMKRFGIPGIKAVLDRRGFVGGDPRLPLAPLSPAEAETATGIWRAAMNRAGFA
ncbi:MAG: dihydrodipicolinate synthase family protein [Caldilineales bacterium]|nr:dihydrodipicolinate synthase family protein [Caldilineales bacterium]MCW5858016.1 dihydrodipicolinate synthase family protein [Caldilineales bacterium]